MKAGKLLALIPFILAVSVCVLGQTQPNLENGWKPFGSYDGSHLDTVNVMNGNLMFHGPVLPDVPERGSLKFSFILFGSTKDWQAVCFPNTTTHTWQCDWQKGGGGVILNMTPNLIVHRTLNKSYGGGQTPTTFAAYGYTISTQDGSVHNLHGVAGTEDVNGEPTQFDSVDLSGYHVVLGGPDSVYATVLDNMTVTDRAGNQYQGSFGPATGCSRPAFFNSPAGGARTPIIDDAPAGESFCSQIARVSLLTDRNGNQISLHTPLNSNPTTDSLGKAPPLTSAVDTAAQLTDPTGCVSPHSFYSSLIGYYQDPNGATQPIKICYAEIPIQTAFSQPNPYYPNQPGVYVGEAVTGPTGSGLHFAPPSTVILADGTRWTFDYDSYGELASIGLPTGGSITYTWTTINFNSCDSSNNTQFSRAVSTRTLSDGQGHSSTWTYSWGSPSNGSLTNIVTDPLGNDTVHTFSELSSLAGLPAKCNFYETTTIQYQGSHSAGQPLQRVDTTFGATDVAVDDPTNMVVPSVANVFATDVMTTVYSNGVATKVKKVHKDPDAGLGAGLPIFGNVIVEKEYDWGQGSPGPLLKETDTTYQWQVSNSYLAARMLDLPASVVVKDGSGCALSETDYTYDESAYLTNANITTQHAAPPSAVRGNLTTVTKWVAPATSCNPKSGTSIVSHTNWYDTGEIYQQIDPLGRATTHSYDPAYTGAYTTQTCSPTTNGNTVAHCVSGTYDFNTGVLTSFTNENATTQASGNTPGDAAHTSSYAYDLMFRMTSAASPPDPANNNARAQTSFAYSAPNVFPVTVTRSRSITPGLSDSITSSFDGLGRAYKTQHPLPNGTAEVDTAYDALGRIASVTNPYFSASDTTYGVMQTQYDALNRVTQVTKQDGSVSTIAYNVTPIQPAPGDCTQSTDEAGKQRLTCSDAMGRLIEVHEPGDNFTGTQASGSLSINGVLQSQSGVGAVGSAKATGQVTVSGTDNHSQTVITKCPPRSPPGCEPTSSTLYDSGKVYITVNGHEYDYWFGNSGSSPDHATSVALGLVNAIQTDGARVVNASVPSGGTTVTLAAVNAGSAGNNISFSTGYTYDSTDFPTQGPSFTTSPANGSLSGGADSNPGITVYDQGTVSATVGSLTATVPYGPSTNGTPTAVASAIAAALSASGSPVTASVAGTQVNVVYNNIGTGGNIAVSVSSQSTQTQWTFSPPSFTGSSITLSGGYNPEGPSLDFNYLVTQYAYDGLGNLLTVTQKGDPTVNTSSQWRMRSFTYDSLGRLLAATNPESGTITYGYDADGNLLQKTSPASNQTGSATQTISYCYDPLNRVTGKAYSAQNCTNGLLPSGTAAVSYTYDSGTNGIGHLTSLTDQAGSGSYAYDVMGRTASESRTIAGITESMSYTYNLDGSLKTLTYPSGAVVTYTPDSAGRDISAVDTGNSINYVTGATYGPDSSLTGFISGNSSSFAGVTSSFSFNKRLQPVLMSAASPSQTVFSIGYDFHLSNGDNGNVYALTNNRDHTRDQAFTYDALNRLTSAQNAGTDCSKTTVNGKTDYWGNNYGYDAWGNLLSKSVTKCSAENLSVTSLPNNQLSGYGYDAAGNMTSDPTDSVAATYDAENRIATATRNGVTTTYTYDGDGNRVEKSNGTTGTLYWYMLSGIVAESDLSGNLQSEYVFFDGERVARKDFPGNAVSYYFSDHLKTTDIVTDAQGNIKNESDFYPWGGELQFLDNDSNHYKFTGKERDSETGLDYFGARYYSNGLGRFITPDWSGTPVPVPYADLSDPQTLNQYSYVRNLPTTRADADGHCPDCGIVQIPNSIAELDQQNQASTQGWIGVAKSVANFVPSLMNTFITMGESGSTPIPLLQPSNESQAVGMAFGSAGTTVVSAIVGQAEVGSSTTSQLQGAANRAAESVGPGSGPVHGTEVHTEFASEVKSLGKSNLSTEVSYKNGAEVARGTKGSIRADVVEGPKNAPKAAYDLKTGNAKLTQTRVQQIQKHVPGGSKVPVKEIKPQ